MDLRGGEDKRAFDLPYGLGFQQAAFGRVVVERLQRAAAGGLAQRDESAPQSLEIEIRHQRFGREGSVGEARKRGLAQVENAMLYRKMPAEVAQPGDASAGNGRVQAFEEGAFAVVRQRCARMVASLHVEQQGHVAHGAAHRAFHAHLRLEHFEARPARHQPLRGPEAVDVVVGGGVAQGAAEIAAVGQRHHVERQRHRRAAAGAAGRPGGIEGVECRPEDRVIGVGAKAEFGDVGLADDDGAGLADPLHEELVLVRHETGECRRAEGRAQPPGQGKVLDGNGQAGQRAGGIWRTRIGGVGVTQYVGAVAQRNDGVDQWVRRLDAVEEGRNDLPRRQPPVPDGVGQFRRRKAAYLAGRRQRVPGRGAGRGHRGVSCRAASTSAAAGTAG